MKPKPFSGLNHLTVPCANGCSPAQQIAVGDGCGCRTTCAGRIAAKFARVARGMHGVVRCARRGSGLAEDPVHSCAADRAGALGHPAAVRLGGLTVEVALFLAFHATPVVALRHWWLPFHQGSRTRSALTV